MRIPGLCMLKNINLEIAMISRIIITLILIIFIFGCGEETPEKDNEGKELSVLKPQEKYDPDAIHISRDLKNEHFRSPSSPLPESKKSGFTGLNYFIPSPRYHLQADFIDFENPDTVEILTTKSDDIRQMIRAGKFEFTIDGKTYALTAYLSSDPEMQDEFFVPFKDSTSGASTYGGGRYLDLKVRDGNEYILDFNYAYNPYCAYNKKYSCPLVPDENILQVAINAGEKKY